MFPNDIWCEIMEYFPKPYRKPPHLDAFKSITSYIQYCELSKNIVYQTSLEDTDKYMNSSLYRYIMDDNTFCRRDCGLENKWNPFMAKHCFGLEQSMGSSELAGILDTGYDDRKRINGVWDKNIEYDTTLVYDFTLILDHIYNIESLPWW